MTEMPQNNFQPILLITKIKEAWKRVQALIYRTSSRCNPPSSLAHSTSSWSVTLDTKESVQVSSKERDIIEAKSIYSVVIRAKLESNILREPGGVH